MGVLAWLTSKKLADCTEEEHEHVCSQLRDILSQAERTPLFIRIPHKCLASIRLKDEMPVQMTLADIVSLIVSQKMLDCPFVVHNYSPTMTGDYILSFVQGAHGPHTA